MAYAGKAGQTRQSIELVRTKKGHSGTLVAGVALGLLVGVGLALLIAPQTGHDARRRLRRGMRRLGWRGRDAWDDLTDELRSARRKLRKARRLRREAREAAREALPGV